MRKRILTFFIALGVILTVGAGLLALQPAVFGIFEEEAGSLRMEKTAVYSEDNEAKTGFDGRCKSYFN